MQRLTFDSRHLTKVQDGTKRVTMRFEDPVEVGPALLVFEFDDEITIPGRILSTTARTVSDVSDSEAQEDGFADSTAVLPALREYYPDLELSDTIVLVRFDVD